MTKQAIVGVLIFILSGPAIAEASIISALSGVFSAPVAAASEQTVANSQKMQLLEAPLNPVSSKTVSTANHIDNNALVYAPELARGDSTIYIPEANTISTYKVVAGDTVSGIAEKFRISVNTVMWANNLKKDSKLKIGQNLLILPISGVKHTVASGDTLQGIAYKYKADIEEIIAYNDISGDKLKVGDIVLVPDGELTSTPVQTTTRSLASSNSTSKTNTVLKKVLGVGVAKAEEGYYMRPISGGIRTQGVHGNNAVDLADSCGKSISASADGEVVIAASVGYNGGYGDYVVINHSNGSQTLYAHMQRIDVVEGERVTKGQQIGTIGATGKVHGVTGCHVHFEIRNGGTNPF